MVKFVSKYHLGTIWRLKLCNSLLNIKSSDVILDAGCGEGFISYKLSKKAKKVVGIDISKEVIDYNQKISNSKLEFLTLDLNDLSKKNDGRFDKIICMDVLEHANNFTSIIDNFSKVVKNGGIVLATIPIYKGHGHFKHKNLGDLRDLFHKKGFEIKILRYVQMPFLTKTIHRFVNFIRSLTGYKMKEVDVFDETLSFELRKKETIIFKIYKIIFKLLLLITFFDLKRYRKGKDFILIKIKRSDF